MDNDLNLRVLGDRLVVKEIKADEKTAGGIFLPSALKDDQTALQGTVLKVSHAIATAEEETERIKKEDIVLYSKFAGSPFTHEGVEYKILRITDLLAVVE